MYDLTLDADKSIAEFEDWNEILRHLEEFATQYLRSKNLLTASSTARIERQPEEFCRNIAPGNEMYELLRSVKIGKRRRVGDPAVAEDDLFFVDTGFQDSYDQHAVQNVVESMRKTKDGYLRPESEIAKMDAKLKLWRNRNPSDSHWVSNLLAEWRNPVVRSSGATQATDNRASASKGSVAMVAMAATGADTDDTAVAMPITKQNLAKFKVLGQVDKKFIVAWFPAAAAAAATVDGQTASGVVVIDQHAADERVRLEAILRETFPDACRGGPARADAMRLDPPVPVVLDERDAIAALRYRRAFARWGIEFADTPAVPPPHGHADTASDCQQQQQLFVTKLPRAVAARCVADRDMLGAVVAEHVRRIDEAAASNRGCVDPAAVAAAVGCPKGVMHMLNSKACRSAIMFGDALDAASCKQVVDDLKGCDFPFQCAHGRPSMNLVCVVRATSKKRAIPGLYKIFGRQT
ncbi:DNA mismatch repair protein [Entophlyctis luteolus]|nr:DNA mismatch repair protein [Entophlyctis luteolus]